MQNAHSASNISRVVAAALTTGAISLMAGAIEAQSQNTPGSFLEVENGKIYYEECGTGDEAVVLVHDGVVRSAVWDDVWPAFCKKFHAIRYDLPGLRALAGGNKMVHGNRRLVCTPASSEGGAGNDLSAARTAANSPLNLLSNIPVWLSNWFWSAPLCMAIPIPVTS